jgi:hypothetical protein
LEKYKASIKETQQNEQVIIDDIIKELAKKRVIAIHKKKQALLKDEVGSTEGKKIVLIMFFPEFLN